MSNGRRQKASQGGYSGGRAALGYCAKRGTKKNCELIAARPGLLKEPLNCEPIYPGWSLRQLAEQLNEEGYTTAQGKMFKPMQVKRILDREEFYNGFYFYGDIVTKGKHKAIL